MKLKIGDIVYVLEGSKYDIVKNEDEHWPSFIYLNNFSHKVGMIKKILCSDEIISININNQNILISTKRVIKL